MDLKWLEDFEALGEHLNFSRAADARHVTQPAFSRRVQALEAWVGTPLFRRTSHGVALTPAGEYMRSWAADIARDLQQMRRGTLKAAGRERATLTIAATHALSFTFFPGWVRAQLPLEALGTLNLVSDTMAASERVFAAAETDFLLCHHHAALASRFDQGRVESVLVGEDLLLPVAAPDAEGRARFALPGRAAQPVRYLGYSASSGLGRILQAAGRSSGKGLWLDMVFTSPLAAALQTMAKQGHGLAWLPQSLVSEDLADGTLVVAGTEAHTLAIEVRLFRFRDRKHPEAEAFWQAVTSHHLG